jgi:hypothetical protein
MTFKDLYRLSNVSLRLASRWLLFVAPIVVTLGASCSKGSKVFSMKNQGAESVDVNATTGQDGATSGTFSKNAATSQRMAAGAGSGIDGAQVLIPAGGLSIDVNVTMGQGANNASDALAAALGLGAGFSGSGQPVVLSSTPPTDVSNPMQITLPPPSGASLWFNLAGDENWAVIYESLKVGENGTFFSGIIPRSEFTVKDGKVVLTAKHFGTYQTVIPKVEVKAKIELPGRAVDLAASVKVAKPGLTKGRAFNISTVPIRIIYSGDKEKLKDKFKEFRYTTNGVAPTCSDTTSSASSVDPTDFNIVFSADPVVVKAVACTVSGEASEVAQETYNYDYTVPVVTISQPSPTTVKFGGTVAFTVNYTDNDQLVVNLTRDKVTVTPNTLNFTIRDANSSTPIIEISGFNFDGTASVTIAAGGAQDRAGNLAPAAGPSTNVDVKAALPQVSSFVKDGSSTKTNQAVSFTVTFSESISAPSLTGSDLGNAGSAPDVTWVITPSTGTASTFTVSGVPSGKKGTIKPKIKANSVLDADSNLGPSAEFVAIDEVSYSADPLTVSVNQASGQADPSRLPLNWVALFSEDVEASLLTSAKLTINAGTSAASASQFRVTRDATNYKKFLISLPAETTGLFDGTISVSIDANKVTDVFGNSNQASTSTDNSIKLDVTAPSVDVVSSTLANGSYPVGTVIPITIKFFEIVSVTGTPQIQLETGANDKSVDYSSGSGTDTLTFNYTVETGHNSTDLNYTSTTALALNGGTIKDAVGNDAVLTLPGSTDTGRLASQKDIVVDTTSPTLTFTSISPTSPGSSPTPQVTVTVSEAATILLYNNNTCSTAISSAVSGTNGANLITTNSLTANSTVNIYGKATDAVGNVSACTSLTTYTYSSGGGTPPSSSAVYGDLSLSHERKVVFDGTRYWAFWRSPDGLKYGYYGTGGALTVIASPVLSGVQKFGVVGKSINSSYQVVIAYSEDGTSVKLIAGTVSGQTISWGTSQVIFTVPSIIKYSNPSVIFATDNKLVVAASQESQGLFEVNVKKSTDVYTSTAPGNFSSAGLKTPHKLSSFGSLALAPLGFDNFNVTISGADGAILSYQGLVDGSGSLTDFTSGTLDSITSRPTSLLMAGRAGVSLNGNETNASVNVVKVIAGELYIGGQFDSVGGIAANNVAKWNGWRWLPLGSGVSGPVNAIQEFNGKIFVGGLFSSAGNTAAQNIAAWDGRAWSAPGGVVDAAILAMAVSNNELFVGGAFSKFKDSTSLGRLVKTSDGGTWTSAASDVFPSGFAVTALHDVGGALYAAGYNVNTGLSSLAKYTTIWSTPILLTGEIKAMASDATHLYLVGGITAVSGVSGLPTLNKMVKVTHSGTAIWSCVGTCSDFSPGSGSVNGVLVEGSAVYVVGDFVSQIKVYEAGNWSDVGYGLGGGPAKTLVRQAGKLIVGGGFNEGYNSTDKSIKIVSKGIASFESAKWSALGAGFTQPVKKVLNLGTNISLVWTKGAGYLGSLYSPSGLFVYNDSAGWTSISLPDGINAANVSDVIVDSGTVYVAFATGTNNTTSKVFKYSAAVWAKVGVDIDDYRAQRLIVEGNKIYALGRHVDHTTSKETDILEHMLSSGSTGLWPSGVGFGNSMSKDINDAIKIGNNFYVAHSTGVSRYQAVEGWTTVHQTFNGPVYSLAFSGANGTGSLVAGGTFETLHNGSTNPVFNNLAAINLSSGVPEGLWVPIGAAANVGVVCSSTPCVASVNSLEFSGTQLYVGGRFDKVNGSTVSPNFAKVSLSNLSSPTWTALGYEAPLSSVSISGSDIWFGGAFGIARLSPNILAKVTSFSAISATSSTSLVYGDAVTGDLRRADYTGSRWTLSGGPISDANSNWPSFVNVGGTSTNYVVTWTTNGKLYYRKYTGTWAGIMSLTTFIDVSSPSISLDFATSGQIPVTFSRGNGFTTIESAQIP